MLKNIITAILLIVSTTALTQGFKPEQELIAISGPKKNIGISAAVMVDNDLKWSQSAGWSCEESKLSFTSTTLTRIASISKNFTAVAIMQLVEKKQLNLDLPIGNYLKNLPVDKRQITTRQLLAHTSGIPQYKGESEIENTTYYPTMQDAMQVFIERPLLFEPGTKYFYTTYGYVVLGRIIEAISSMTYEDYMNRYVFGVAGMSSTQIEYKDNIYKNKSCLYHNNGRKVKTGQQNDLSNRVPGGGYLSTQEDLIKFGQALLNGKLISHEILKEMLQIQQVTYNGNKYGLGWYLYGPPPNEGLVIGHSGGQTGCTSQLMIVPKTKTVVVVLSNTSGNYPEIATFASKLIGYSEE